MTFVAHRGSRAAEFRIPTSPNTGEKWGGRGRTNASVATFAVLAPARLLIQTDAQRGLCHDFVRQERIRGMNPS
jgi:hypothetical protein